MGLHRAWWVPHGLKATDGAYVLQPTDEMFAIICLESHRAGAGVVGENLGTVPQEIADAAVFLASPRSGYTTGSNLIVDGAISNRVNF